MALNEIIKPKLNNEPLINFVHHGHGWHSFPCGLQEHLHLAVTAINIYMFFCNNVLLHDAQNAYICNAPQNDPSLQSGNSTTVEDLCVVTELFTEFHMTTDKKYD